LKLFANVRFVFAVVTEEIDLESSRSVPTFLREILDEIFVPLLIQRRAATLFLERYGDCLLLFIKD